MEAAQRQHDAPRRRDPKRDLTLALSASGAIFAGLVGTDTLDGSTASHYMSWADHASHRPLGSLRSFCSPSAPTRHRTTGPGSGRPPACSPRSPGPSPSSCFCSPGFGFTRDSDHVRLLLHQETPSPTCSVCAAAAAGRTGSTEGSGQAALEQECVIFNFDKNLQAGPCVHSVDIPRADVLQIEEAPGELVGCLGRPLAGHGVRSSRQGSTMTLIASRSFIAR